jgi:hypothetical protein
MQSLKYIFPVILVIALISGGMLMYDKSKTASTIVDGQFDSTLITNAIDSGAYRVTPVLPTSLVSANSNDLSWIDLADVTFEDKYYKEIDGYLLYPSFGERVKSFEGKKVNLPGYMIPINPDSGQYVLSAFAMSSCFFCGAAGPESVVLLELKEGHREYKIDEWLTFEGVFRTNDNDINKLNYIIEDAVEIGNKE